MAENRCIVIVGAAYCGSTFLSRLFASVPGVASVGEAKRLYRVVTEQGPVSEASCTVCKPPGSCPHFGPRNEDLYDPTTLTRGNLYLRLLMQFRGCRTLVTSDKERDVVKMFTAKGAPDLVVLFKRPEAAILSKLRNDARWGPQTMSEAAHHYEVEYSDRYGGALAWVDGWARRSYWVSYEHLAMDPDHEFGLLCKAMDLPAPSFIDFGNIEWHQIGGNIRSLASRWALLDERWRTELTDEQKKEIAGYDTTQEVFRQLLARALETRLEAHRKDAEAAATNRRRQDR